MPYLVRSKLKLASAGVGDGAFDSFLESSLQEESKRVVLEVGWVVLASLYLLRLCSHLWISWFIDAVICCVLLWSFTAHVGEQ